MSIKISLKNIKIKNSKQQSGSIIETINANFATKTLQIKNITKSFGYGKNKKTVLKGVSFSIEKGKVTSLLGPNGAGKTTCFSIISGLIKPDTGSIFLNDINITKYPMFKRARLGIGYLPQEASIFRGMTVRENLLSILELKEKDNEILEDQVQKLMNDFTISHLENQYANKLSGGERRRVEIARAIAANPDFILLDEPFAGIDPITIKEMRKLISHLKDRGIGVIITEHNVRETLAITDIAYIIAYGKLIAEGTANDIIRNEEVRRIYLGDTFVI